MIVKIISFLTSTTGLSLIKKLVAFFISRFSKKDKEAIDNAKNKKDTSDIERIVNE